MKKNNYTYLTIAAGTLCSLFLASSVFAQDGGAASQVFSPAPVSGQNPPSFGETLMSMLPMLAMCYMIFYFMVIRPQEKKTKAQKELMEAMKRGDSVVTSGGLFGKVASVEKGVVVLEIAPSVKVRVEQNHIARFEKDGASAEAA
jgi:preprotein translocase subunit YajC